MAMISFFPFRVVANNSGSSCIWGIRNPVLLSFRVYDIIGLITSVKRLTTWPFNSGFDKFFSFCVFFCRPLFVHMSFIPYVQHHLSSPICYAQTHCNNGRTAFPKIKKIVAYHIRNFFLLPPTKVKYHFRTFW